MGASTSQSDFFFHSNSAVILCKQHVCCRKHSKKITLFLSAIGLCGHEPNGPGSRLWLKDSNGCFVTGFHIGAGNILLTKKIIKRLAEDIEIDLNSKGDFPPPTVCGLTISWRMTILTLHIFSELRNAITHGIYTSSSMPPHICASWCQTNVI